MRRSMSLMAVVCAMAACGGDDTGSTDHGVVGHDLGISAADTRRSDGARPDQRQIADNNGQPGAEAGGPASLSGSITISPSISCGSAAANDCRGILFVGVVNKPLAPPQSTLLGSQTIDSANLAAGPVPFQVTGLTSGSTVYLSAMLVENGPVPDPRYPKAGDLVTEPKPVVLKSGSNTADLQLDARWK